MSPSINSTLNSKQLAAIHQGAQPSADRDSTIYKIRKIASQLLIYMGLVGLLLGIGLSPIIKNSVGAAIIVTIVLALLCFLFNPDHSALRSNRSLPAHLQAGRHSFLIVCMLYFISALIAFAAEGEETRKLKDLDIPIRFILIPLFGYGLSYLFSHQRINIEHIGYAFLIAASAALATAIHERYFIHHPMVLGATNHHILFSFLSMVIASMCLALPYRYRSFALVGFLLAVSAVLLSTSRGTWPLIVLIPCLHLLFFRKDISPISFILTIGISLGLLFLFYMTPSTGVKIRVFEGYQNIVAYFTEDQHVSSMGLRFEMWKGAWNIFQSNWVFGAGLNEYTTGIAQLVSKGEIRDLLHIYGHPHNDLLNALSTKGIIGGAAYLSLLVVPGCYFFFTRRSVVNHPSQNPTLDKNLQRLCLAGLYAVITFAVAGLTEALLHRNFSATYYLFIITLMYVLIDHYQRGRASLQA